MDAADVARQLLVEVGARTDAGRTYSYSGRGMYGKRCVSVRVDRVQDLTQATAGVALDIITSADDNSVKIEKMEVLEKLAGTFSMDSLGRGVVCYWPRVESVGTDESGDDE